MKFIKSFFVFKGALISLVFILANIQVHAQTRGSFVAYIDNFYSNANGWPKIDDSSCMADLGKEVYWTFRTKLDAPKVFTKKVDIDQGRDFYLTTEIQGLSWEFCLDLLPNFKLDTTEPYLGCGLVWGCENDSNYYAFQYNKENSVFRVIKCTDNIISSIIPWKKVKNVFNKDRYDYEFLYLQKSRDSLHFYINEKSVANIPYIPFSGNRIGFVNYAKGGFDARYISLHYYYTINPVPDAGKGLIRERLSNNVNSTSNDIEPCISPDGKYLYITRKSIEKEERDVKQTIWFSSLQSDSTWSLMRDIGRPLNNFGTNAVVSITPDNNRLLVEGHYSKERDTGVTDGFSFTTRKQDGSWGFPEPLIIKNYKNESHYLACNLSCDGKVLIMSSELVSKGFGDNDLYVSFLQEDNTWTEPKNMGQTINTAGEDQSPYLAADGKTLYYSTTGKPGYGQADVFVSRRLDDTWTNWSEPQNLGPEINTSEWDGGYVISTKGDWAYYSSHDDKYSKYNSDIYRIRLPDSAKPAPVALVSGKIYSCDSQTISAKVTYYDVEQGKEMGFASSSLQDGTYTIVLPAGKKYVVRANDEDYFYVSDTFDLQNLKEYKEYSKNFSLCREKLKGVMPSDLNNREVNIQNTVTVKHKNIELRLWDDEIQDGDTISLSINGKWILERYMLEKKKKSVFVELKSAESYIVMFAHNEGLYKPNTAAISVIDGGVEHRLDLKSTLHASGAVNIFYRPDK